MDDRLWRLLEDSGCTCVSELRVHFATPWHVACSVDSLEDAIVLAEQVVPKASSAEHKRIGGHVWKWISDNTDLLSRVQARLRSKATRIEASAGSKVSPGEVFDQLMSGSLELCKQTSRAHSRWISNGAGTPVEAEKAAKRFWGTVLVQIMVEARLPIVEIAVESEEQRVMYALRALGTRRSKTLRNRARTWRKARDWIQSVKGYVFPRSPADVVDYLIFLEQESGTKSCIAEFMSALSVLEDAGQVPVSNQLCKNRLVVAASKGSAAEVQQGKTGKKQEPCFKFAKPEVISNYMRLIWRQLKASQGMMKKSCLRISGLGSVNEVLNQTWPLLGNFTDRQDASLSSVRSPIMDPAAQRRYLKDNVDADFVFLLEEHGQVSQAQLNRLSELLPDEDRVRQSEDTIQGQRSFTSGAFVHKDRAGTRRNLDAFPFASELLARLVASNFPGRVFSSTAFFRDLKQPLHKDTTNGRYDNLLLACSDFVDGGLWVQSDAGDVERLVNGVPMLGKSLDWEERKIVFNPHVWHSTEDWGGCRLVLAAYTIGNDGLLALSEREKLSNMGFVLPGQGKRGPPDSGGSCEDDGAMEHVEPTPVGESQVDEPGEPGPLLGDATVEDLPFSELKSGCEGPPMVGDFAGATDEFVDGFGRCSPGRWKPSCRGRCLSPAAVAFARSLRDKIRRFVLDNVPDLAKSTFRLATGHWEGPLFASGPMDKLREEWFDMLPDPLRAREMIPHQPFYLRAIAQTLRILEDPDYRIIEEGKFCFCNGVEVGHTSPLGPVPQVFRRRQKGQKYDDSEWEPLMGNYRDGPEVEKALLEAFEKEEAEGRMFPLSFAEARNRYPGSSLRIAAQADIPKPDQEFRVVHDGTHGVQVNNEIVMNDRLESPGAREVSAIQKLGSVASGKVLFGLVGDVKKAHRRYLHHPEHWGVLACRSRTDSPTVWLNRTGTFGIASAAFWFARLIGLVGRLSLRVLLDAFVFALIYADDLHLLSGGPNRWLNLWMLLALFCLQGTPFSEKKRRGGLQVDWVGYWIDYGRFKLGISEKRCQWIIRSVESMEGDGWLVDVRRFHELHGRLGFMSQVLVWMRPFLAPGYA
ncbi:unnamed protein product [Symbiodinium necroappetens]|uniref:Uncharacterized protein n=1 Tax=Symbiodinium necroappetens TaxID=1628268 RepID=A0A812XAN7_9DINO|nr:unnamed protein product [Symbiodinium necroappetens]